MFEKTMFLLVALLIVASGFLPDKSLGSKLAIAAVVLLIGAIVNSLWAVNKNKRSKLVQKIKQGELN
jgi:uncharacterized membrane protein YqjE